jgi:hypothetical protein
MSGTGRERREKGGVIEEKNDYFYVYPSSLFQKHVDY